MSDVMEESRGEAWTELQWRGWITSTCLTEVEDHHTAVFNARHAASLLHIVSHTSPEEFRFLRMISQLHLGEVLHHYLSALFFPFLVCSSPTNVLYQEDPWPLYKVMSVIMS